MQHGSVMALLARPIDDLPKSAAVDRYSMRGKVWSRGVIREGLDPSKVRNPKSRKVNLMLILTIEAAYHCRHDSGSVIHQVPMENGVAPSCEKSHLEMEPLESGTADPFSTAELPPRHTETSNATANSVEMNNKRSLTIPRQQIGTPYH